MNYFKFLYDVFVYITSHYSMMPDDFKKRFPEAPCISSRLYLSSVVQPDSDINNEFKDYE